MLRDSEIQTRYLILFNMYGDIIRTERHNISSVLILFILAVLIGFSHHVYGLEQLPDNVYLKTSQQGLSHENYYALINGRIWIKPNESTTGIKGDWKLFDGT